VSAEIAFVSSYPPRQCGVAQYVMDLRNGLGRHGAVYALERHGRPSRLGPMPHEVRMNVADDDPTSLRAAASSINRTTSSVVSLQHEFGLFGGPDGQMVLELSDALEKPVVVTMHTVLRTPSPRQRMITVELARRAAAVVVMSQTAETLLRHVYGVDSNKIRVIPHGVPERRGISRAAAKDSVGSGSRALVMSFGLVGPGKGYEHAIEAMAGVRSLVPNAEYVVLGATHPDLIASEGEAYRRSLERRVADLDLSAHVRFEDRFVSPARLATWLAATDVFITPYPNLQQIVSGTLSYALGAGRAIVSTRYAYAVEMLGSGAGVLVDTTPSAIGDATTSILLDPGRQATLERAALAVGDRMRWGEVASSYAAVFEDVGVERRRATPSMARPLAARA
jgi:glycosyltransferase involved in cell wall biosynthesis